LKLLNEQQPGGKGTQGIKEQDAEHDEMPQEIGNTAEKSSASAWPPRTHRAEAIFQRAEHALHQAREEALEPQRPRTTPAATRGRTSAPSNTSAKHSSAVPAQRGGKFSLKKEVVGPKNPIDMLRKRSRMYVSSHFKQLDSHQRGALLRDPQAPRSDGRAQTAREGLAWQAAASETASPQYSWVGTAQVLQAELPLSSRQLSSSTYAVPQTGGYQEDVRADKRVPPPLRRGLTYEVTRRQFEICPEAVTVTHTGLFDSQHLLPRSSRSVLSEMQHSLKPQEGWRAEKSGAERSRNANKPEQELEVAKPFFRGVIHRPRAAFIREEVVHKQHKHTPQWQKSFDTKPPMHMSMSVGPVLPHER